MAYKRKNDNFTFSEDEGVQKEEVVGKLRNHLQKVINELDRVNRIALQQEDQIDFLRNRLDQVVEKCNRQAYLIHDLQEKLRIMEVLGEEKSLKENEILTEEEKKELNVFVESVFENRPWFEEGKRIEESQEIDFLRMENIQLGNTNEMLLHEKEVLVDQVKELKKKIRE